MPVLILLYTLSPLIIIHCEVDTWAGNLSFAPPDSPYSLLYHALCPVKLTCMGCIHCSFPLWLMKARAGTVGWRRVESVYLFSLPHPRGFAKPGMAAFVFPYLSLLLPGSTLETAASPSSSTYSPSAAFHGVMALAVLSPGVLCHPLWIFLNTSHTFPTVLLLNCLQITQLECSICFVQGPWLYINIPVSI